MSETAHSDFDEITDPGLVSALYREAAKLKGVQVEPADQPRLDQVTQQGFEYPEG